MGICIHIIEDDPSVRNAVEELLLGDGRTVRSYIDPDAFFASAAIGPSDIIILDIAFPSGSGIEAANRLKRDHPSVKIVVISGVRGLTFARAQAAIAPAASFRKPLDGAALLETIGGFILDK